MNKTESSKTTLNLKVLNSSLNPFEHMPSSSEKVAIENENRGDRLNHDANGKSPFQNWWTGVPPVFLTCPGVDAGGKIHSLPQLRLDRCSRRDMLEYFQNSWALTEVLFSSLKNPAAFFRAPIHQLRHPLIFYYGHPAVLYVNKLRIAGFLTEPVDAYFEQVFETGVDEMSWDDMSKNEMKWPSIATVTEYRRRVYKIVVDLIQTHPALESDRRPFLPDSQAWAMAMAFEHERIHIETTTVLIREMPIESIARPASWPANGLTNRAPISNETLSAANSTTATTLATATTTATIVTNLKLALQSVPEGVAHLGKPREFASFGWDNEYGSQSVLVPTFEAANTLVSNDEFLAFVKDGGYREARFWSSEGWRWRQFRNTKWPAFWVPNGPAGLYEFQIRLIFEIVEWQGDLPAVVNLHEAKAFASWLSERDKLALPYRLMSEVEHHRLRQITHQDASPNENSNLGLRFGSERSVHANPVGGWSDVFGNSWQWCEDEFHPLPGFEVHPYYDDFSVPCFDGKHHLIMGGSFVSTGDEASVYARFHFRPHFFQHAGFRLVKPNPSISKTSFHFKDNGENTGDYESRDLLNQYLLLHYGAEESAGPKALLNSGALNFPQRCAQVAIDFAKREKTPLGRALEVGCATGGAAFQLSAAFKEVIGVDLSESFIKSAQALARGEQLNYKFKVEGDIYHSATAQLPENAHVERVTFRQADACSMPAEYMGFDLVLLANLICRLPSPKSCLQRMMGSRGLVAPGGLLVLVSPYSWLEEHTQKSAWLGGFEKNGQEIRTSDRLKEMLSPEFDLIHVDDMPLVIREHARKYQYIVSHLMVWKKRG